MLNPLTVNPPTIIVTDDEADLPNPIIERIEEFHEVVETLRKIDVNALSPLEALTTLYELKRLLDEQISSTSGVGTGSILPTHFT
ncbi:MAG UNVERIFIED_CONTAM: hypothetical protein LVT10_14260 [Anaerolineae bacterium]